MFPGPIISTFGAHELRVIFSSDSSGTANGFNAIYEIRKSRKEDVPLKRIFLNLNMETILLSFANKFVLKLLFLLMLKFSE